MVVLNNSYSRITGLSAKDFSDLRKLLSYQIGDNAFFSGKHYNRTKYCIDAKGTFPTGVWPRVYKFLKSRSLPIEVNDTRVSPTSFVDHKLDLGDIKAYPEQLAAAEAVQRNGRMIIRMPTGSGKSLVIALITASLGVRTLVVVPSLQIKEQLLNSLQGVLKDMSNVTVENIDSRALRTAGKYDCLIIDEAHHVAAKTYHKLNRTAWSGIHYRAFLTATPFRNKDEETLLFEGIAGSDAYTLTHRAAVQKGYITQLEAYYVELAKVETEAETWAEVYSQLVVHHKARNEKIALMLGKLKEMSISTLCLVKEIKHGDNIMAETDSFIPFANGQDDTTRAFIGRFNSGQLPALIGTTGIVGEGVDTKPCEFVIIAGLGKAKSAFMQQVGRCLRTYPGKRSGKVLLIKDKSHKFLLRHFNAQVKILKEEYGITITKLEF